MNAVQIISLVIGLIESLKNLLPELINNAKAKGELTEEQEADFQRRKEEIFARDYAQPAEDSTPETPPSPS